MRIYHAKVLIGNRFVPGLCADFLLPDSALQLKAVYIDSRKLRSGGS